MVGGYPDGRGASAPHPGFRLPTYDDSRRPWPSWTIGLLIFMIILAFFSFLFAFAAPGAAIAGIIFLLIGFAYPAYRLTRPAPGPTGYYLSPMGLTMIGDGGGIDRQLLLCEHVTPAALHVQRHVRKDMFAGGQIESEVGIVQLTRDQRVEMQIPNVEDPRNVIGQITTYIRGLPPCSGQHS